MAKTGRIRTHSLPDGTLVVLEGGTDRESGFAAFQQMLQDEPGRFAGSGLIVDVGQRELSTGELLDLEEQIRRYLGTRVLQIVHGEAAEILEEYGSRSEEPPQARPAAATATPSVFATGERAHLIRRTLRSGQRITYDGSIIILGDVNPGAEILATGDVIVWGALRGVAHAGARGSLSRCIVALRLLAVQLRIGPLIGRAPDDGHVSEIRPEVAYVRDGRIVVDALAPQTDAAGGQGGNILWDERWS